MLRFLQSYVKKFGKFKIFDKLRKTLNMKLRKNQSFVIVPTILVDWWKEQYLTHQEQKLFLTFSWMFWDIEVDLSYKI